MHALEENFSLTRKICENSFFCPMVKTNAYGHGLFEVSKALEDWGAEFLGVADMKEATSLRDKGLKTDILVFNCFYEKELESCLEMKITPVLSSWEQAYFLEKQSSNAKVHIKFDTGMTRLGFPSEEAEKLASFFKRSKKIKVEGVCTHFAKAEDSLEKGSYTQKQILEFEKTLSFFPGDCEVHALNSAALMASQENESLKKFGARPGLCIYGIFPYLEGGETLKAKIPLKPVMSLDSEVLVYHHVKKGQKVSYSCLWEASRDSIVGVVPLGYGDGYRPRKDSFVFFRNQKVPVVGKVCMSYFMVDLTDAISSKKGEMGEKVVVFDSGNLQGIPHLSDQFEASYYEVLTGWNASVQREFTKGL